MTYIENIFLCMVSPLLVAALYMGRRQLRFFLFCIAEWEYVCFPPTSTPFLLRSITQTPLPPRRRLRRWWRKS